MIENNPKKCTCVLLTCFQILFLLSISLESFAFLGTNGGFDSLDMGATIRASSSLEKFVENSLYPEQSSFHSQSASLRGSLDYSASDVISLQCHAVIFYDNRKQNSPIASIGVVNHVGIDRSSFFYEQHDYDPVIIFDLDRLNVTYAKNRVRMTLGRQAINLATTFYFSPNDIFAPFAANTFYRIYKPGVDAFRLDKDVGELGQFNFIYVANFEFSQQESEWSRTPDGNKNSVILRYSDVIRSFTWSALGGQVRGDDYLGFSLQGDWFEWLGIRAEGQLVHQHDNKEDSLKSFTIGLEHRWQNSFDLRLEYFFNGFGKKQKLFSVSDLYLNNDKSNAIYPGRQYLALGQGYELSPLLYMQSLLMVNVNNRGSIFSIDLNYSLSDDMEVNIGASTALNITNSNSSYSSEFSYYPDVLNVELRAYY